MLAPFSHCRPTCLRSTLSLHAPNAADSRALDALASSLARRCPAATPLSSSAAVFCASEIHALRTTRGLRCERRGIRRTSGVRHERRHKGCK